MDEPRRRASGKEEAAEFFSILTHDDRNSRYIVATAAEGTWSERAYKAEELASLELPQGPSCYVTRNGFNGRKREANRCRQVNALMFDIDCHGGNHEVALPKLVNQLQEAFFDAVLPLPNLLVDTGRGIQVYYVLDRSTPVRVRGGNFNESGVTFFRDVETGLAARISEVVSSLPGTKLDTSVFDFSRVGRIPGTFNVKAGRPCKLIFSSDDYYSLADLKMYCVKRKRSRKGFRRKSNDRMLESRKRLVENLQEHRNYDCRGSRENMCFVFYNCATQLAGPDEAFELTCSFNEAFTHPLPKSDIASIKRTVDSVTIAYGPHKGESGFYPMKTSTFVEKLFMTEEEIHSLGVYSPSRKLQRERAKALTKQKRAERDVRICSMYAKGYKQLEIARRTGCSLRTVSSVIARENVVKGNLSDTVRGQYELVLQLKGSKESIYRQIRKFLSNELGGDWVGRDLVFEVIGGLPIGKILGADDIVRGLDLGERSGFMHSPTFRFET